MESNFRPPPGDDGRPMWAPPRAPPVKRPTFYPGHPSVYTTRMHLPAHPYTYPLPLEPSICRCQAFSLLGTPPPPRCRSLSLPRVPITPGVALPPYPGRPCSQVSHSLSMREHPCPQVSHFLSLVGSCTPHVSPSRTWTSHPSHL